MARRETLGVAVVGCGAIARQYHLRALRRIRSARVVAVADPDAGARERAARMSKAEPLADIGAVLARRDVEAVVVCAPNAAHAELAMAVAGAGRHLYLEKPLAVATASGEAIVTAVERSGVVAAVGLSFRFDPLYLRARELIASGTLGRLREISTVFREPAPGGMPEWKRSRASGGGVLLDLGTHHLDLLTWLTGDALLSVDRVELRSDVGEHDRASVAGLTTSGADFEARFGYGGPPRCAWVIAGDRARLEIDRHAARVALVPNGARAPRPGARERVRAGMRSLPVLGRERFFALALRAWVERIQGADHELPGVRDGLRALQAVEAIEAVAIAGAGAR
jgi:predicted dehydrogenase